MSLKPYFLAILLSLSSLSQATKLDLESVQDSTEMEKIYDLTKDIFKMPKEMAAQYLIWISELPSSGWQAPFLLRLKALDLMAYIYEVEKAQFYASAGKWNPPDHLYKDKHIEFYQTRINPMSILYSEGISKETSYYLGKHVLGRLLDYPSPQGLEILKTLAQSGREFWKIMILRHVFPHRKASTELIKDLISIMELPVKEGRISLTEITEAIFVRQGFHKTNDAKELIGALYGRVLLRGESEKAAIYGSYSSVIKEISCMAILNGVDTTFLDANGGKSLLK